MMSLVTCFNPTNTRFFPFLCFHENAAAYEKTRVQKETSLDSQPPPRESFDDVVGLTQKFTKLKLKVTITDLPSQVIGKALSFLPVPEILRAYRVCSLFNDKTSRTHSLLGRENAYIGLSVREGLKGHFGKFNAKVFKWVNKQNVRQLDLNLSNESLDFVPLYSSHYKSLVVISQAFLKSISAVFPQLEVLYLKATPSQKGLTWRGEVTDDTIKALQGFSQLKVLVLEGWEKIKGTTFDYLPSSLEWLNVRETGLVDESIKKLKHLKLRHLDVSSCKDFKGLYLESLCDTIQNLVCDNFHPSFSAPGSFAIDRLKNLRGLSLRFCHTLPESSFKILPQTLETLDMCDTHVPNQAVWHLARLINLKKAHLVIASISAEDFLYFPASLQRLHFRASCPGWTPFLPQGAIYNLQHLKELKELYILDAFMNTDEFQFLPKSLEVLSLKETESYSVSYLPHAPIGVDFGVIPRMLVNFEELFKLPNLKECIVDYLAAYCFSFSCLKEKQKDILIVELEIPACEILIEATFSEKTAEVVSLLMSVLSSLKLKEANSQIDEEFFLKLQALPSLKNLVFERNSHKLSFISVT